MLGAVTEHYLLELSRLVTRSTGERNYHIFYQVCAGLTQHVPELSGMLGDSKEGEGLADKYDAFGILLDEAQDSHYSAARAERDSAEFKETLDAMAVLGVSEEERTAVLEIVATVLLLGNLEFDEDAKGSSSTVESDGGAMMNTIAGWLDLEAENLRMCLCQRTVQAARRVSVTVVPLTKQQVGGDCCCCCCCCCCC
jgi:myosin heavy subunit